MVKTDQPPPTQVRWMTLPAPNVLLAVGYEVVIDPAAWAALDDATRQGVYAWARGELPPKRLYMRARGTPDVLRGLERSLAAISDEVWAQLLDCPVAAMEGPPALRGRSSLTAPLRSGWSRARAA